MLEELVHAHLTEYKVSGRTIEQRVAWEQLSRIERLERALKTARAKMFPMPALSTRTN